MTLKVRSYNNWEEQVTDGISEWFWTHIGRAVIVGAAISIPMFGFGALTAPQGINRVDAGVQATAAGHEFLWKSAGHALAFGLEAVEPVIENK